MGPALACLVIRVIPLAPPHAAGLLLISLAPTAPFFPLMVRRARGDMSSAGAFMLVATVGTVVFLPLLAPLLINGLTVGIWTLAKPLLTLVLLPLLAGFVIRACAPRAAGALFPVVKRGGAIFLLMTAVLTVILYGQSMLSALGSYAIGAQILFLGVLAGLSYAAGPGLTQGQRSAMSLGMCTRNIAAVFIAYFGITDPDPGIFVMIVLVVPLALSVALIAARLFAGQAGVERVGGEAQAAVGRTSVWDGRCALRGLTSRVLARREKGESCE